MFQLFESDEYLRCAGVEKGDDFIPSFQSSDIDIDGEMFEVYSEEAQILFKGLRSRMDEAGTEIRDLLQVEACNLVRLQFMRVS